ncbi:MAG: methyltransferase domain-containing protein [Burkholderiaceae bacterium]|nr:methyltransferase domain-containing protein [Burkholderiaceae bacterium]
MDSHRPTCRFCAAGLRHVIADLGMTPMANAYRSPAEQDRMEPFYPLRAWVCDACLLVQLEEFETPEQIFAADYAYFSSYSDSWVEHARRYVEDVSSRFRLGPNSRVVEVACNDGYLLRWFLPKGVKVLGVEPAANCAEAARARGIEVEVEFFGARTAARLKAQGYQADLMVANNVVAHVPNLNDFVEGFRILLAPTGVVTFEFHHVLNLVRYNQFDTIYHEHFCYHSLSTFRRILARQGLSVFDVEELPTHGGSLRVYAQPQETGIHPTTTRVPALLEAERAAGLTSIDAYLAYGERIKRMKRQLLRFLIDAREAGKSIAAYGAPAKGNTLLNYVGVGTDFIDYTVDRNPHKQGMTLPGTGIPIHDPAKIFETRPDYLLILPWNLRDEIVRQMAGIREWGGRFLVLIPEVKVID